MSSSRADIVSDRLQARLSFEWQDTESLIQDLIPVVPPGKALRTYQNRQKVVSKDGSRALTDVDAQTASGARSILNDRLLSMKSNGRVEIDRIDGKRMVRLRERRETATKDGSCPTCQRPFPPAPEKAPQPPVQKARPTVLFPSFPSWDEEAKRKALAT